MALWHLLDLTLTLTLTLLISLPSDWDHLEEATANFFFSQLDKAIKRL